MSSTNTSQFREVWVVNGPGRSGKDTFINFAADYALRAYGLPAHNISSIDPCRVWAKRYFGIEPDDKSDEARKVLIALKQSWIALDAEGPTNYLLDSIRQGENGMYFLHIREPYEIEHLVERAREEGILIRTMHVSLPGQPIPETSADTGTRGTADNPFYYDRDVENDGGIEDLQKQAERFVDEIMQRSGIEALHHRQIEGRTPGMRR